MLQSVIAKTGKNIPQFVKPPLRKMRWALRHIRSAYGGIAKKSIFKDVDTYCMFLGYPRSGHSLVGSLIDAHQEAIIAHELDALLFLQNGFSKFQLFYLILGK